MLDHSNPSVTYLLSGIIDYVFDMDRIMLGAWCTLLGVSDKPQQ